jgi:hypothetical protein
MRNSAPSISARTSVGSPGNQCIWRGGLPARLPGQRRRRVRERALRVPVLLGKRRRGAARPGGFGFSFKPGEETFSICWCDERLYPFFRDSRAKA